MKLRATLTDKWRFATGSACCNHMAYFLDIIFQTNSKWKATEENLDEKTKVPGLYIEYHMTSEPSIIQVHFCPFCGEKIEIVIKNP